MAKTKRQSFHLASLSRSYSQPAHFSPTRVPLLSPLPREFRALVRRTARAGFRREVAPTFSSPTLFLGRGRLVRARRSWDLCTTDLARNECRVVSTRWTRSLGVDSVDVGLWTDHERAEVVAARRGGVVRWSRHDAAMPSVARTGRTAP